MDCVSFMEHRVSKDLPVALYYQVREDIRAKIMSKEWKSGSRIPPESEICKLYNVSRITARKALEELQQEGYLERIQGKGTFVCKKAIEQKLSKFYSFSEELHKKGLKEETRLLEFTALALTDQQAAALKALPGDEAFLITRVRLVDGAPYAYEKSFIPCRIAPELTGQMVVGNGLYRSLKALNVYLDSAEERFRAVNLPDEVARILETEKNAAAISLTRLAFSGITPVEYCESTIRGDFFSYTVELK